MRVEFYSFNPWGLRDSFNKPIPLITNGSDHGHKGHFAKIFGIPVINDPDLLRLIADAEREAESGVITIVPVGCFLPLTLAEIKARSVMPYIDSRGLVSASVSDVMWCVPCEEGNQAYLSKPHKYKKRIYL